MLHLLLQGYAVPWVKARDLQSTRVILRSGFAARRAAWILSAELLEGESRTRLSSGSWAMAESTTSTMAVVFPQPVDPCIIESCEDRALYVALR
jgi:hypothetical protein